ncbi:probable acyl-[acyl-carrier-protein]--UDP-N-acetylglucosamine O-acyltransferase, mitochondrial isoform X5 [Zingiber officinale]|uniref:probable acyl-[acyl-carrier-protein]--UDP-N-acetylglucosamine O-acyltransferase, mitochondrial isoform X5 n=1 Tax=Zingiber officinale TaxID=94328 RepID=UPI001C4C737F|nr:probable acyl-[acyl-carrier-protein]--UDP-N-acetylglucosamine O-acyltransferase, mitochondrial isoform X5 [Zingiber officinale]
MLAVSSLRRLIFSSVRLFSRRRFHADFFGSGESSLIHPTSIIHPDAVLGQGVSIGPFCTVGSAVKIGNACQLHASSHIVGETEIGDHCIIQTGAVVGADLPGLTVLGHHNVVGHYAVVGVKCQDLKYKPGDECFLYIGDHNDIREYSSIHRSSKSCDKTDYVHTSGAIAVHQFCHIGSHSFIGGGAMVTQDIPKFMMVSGGRAELRGLNLEGLRRHGFSEIEEEDVRGMRKAYQKIFMVNEANSGGLDDRLSQVEHDEEVACFSAVTHMVQSIRESFRPNRRGICKFRNPSAS